MKHRHKSDDSRNNDREVEAEAENAADSVDEEMSPLEEVELRRQLALETERFESGIEG
jgi:hypothetical protein